MAGQPPASLAEALAALQAQLPHVAKGQRAKVEKDGRTLYTYDYADLADINAALLPIMAGLGLSFTSLPTLDGAGRFILHYRLMHASGADIDGEYPLPDPARYGPQDLGKAITYARRYALCAVTGLSPGGDDTDAGEVQAKHEKRPRNVPDTQLEQEGRMTRAQLQEHRQLEADTKRSASKAERVRPKAPDPDDPWVTPERASEIRADAEDKPGSILPLQSRAIELMLTRLGIDRSARGDRHEYVRAILKLDELASMSDLTYSQAADAIRFLSDEAAKERTS